MAQVPWKKLWILFKGHLFPSPFQSRAAEIMPRRVGSSLAPLQLLKAMMIWGIRARESTSWDCTEPGRSHCWCSPLVTFLRWAEFELLTSKVLAQSMKSVIVTLQSLITQALGGKCSYLCWTCFWATESYLCWDVLGFCCILPRCFFSDLSRPWEEGSSLFCYLLQIWSRFSLPCLLIYMFGPYCYPLVFLQLVFSLSHSDKVSSYHQKNCCVRHDVDQCTRYVPVFSSLLQGLKHN